MNLLPLWGLHTMINLESKELPIGNFKPIYMYHKNQYNEEKKDKV